MCKRRGPAENISTNSCIYHSRNGKYFVSQKRNMNSRFRSNTKLALIMWSPLANHNVTSCSFDKSLACFVLVPFLFFSVSLENFSHQGTLKFPSNVGYTEIFLVVVDLKYIFLFFHLVSLWNMTREYRLSSSLPYLSGYHRLLKVLQYDKVGGRSL